ncbi:NAD(P)/FAD-dependent oxidoreductase [Nesterenkonia sp. MY13]|uniref:NAD(P)/FAD-dependent oxidoreductase n=1 Tax=Nesterenkonia sedimenti TaxID=1463632 RepID=A0A7X8TLR7_9MICC|nr:NAD(P)/FAD-dependent oxidoreductase [Nesterenkonia sedimenti]NLS10727.1 NAD(P)/FAD-dependent oxidoreductase [Nesterenkonia sedimenti]
MEHHAAIVGSGLNGLVAACQLARAGWKVTVYESSDTPGGAGQSAELFGTGLISDLGASVHPLSAASPAYDALLPEDAFSWEHPGVPAAHAWGEHGDGTGEPVLLHNSLEKTAEGLGEDASLWKLIFGPLTNNWEEVRQAVFTPPSRPFSRLPTPTRVANLALRAAAFMQIGGTGIAPASQLTRAFKTQEARALFTGLAAHSTGPLNQPLTSAFGVILATAAHTVGWPVVRGGTQRITDALLAELDRLGGQVVTGFRVEGIKDSPLPGLRFGIRKNLKRRGYRIEGTRADERGRVRRTGEEVADVVVLNLTPKQVLKLRGLRLGERTERRMRHWDYGPGTVKIDYLVDGPIPWSSPQLAEAGTVHLGGSAAQITASEAAVNKGVLPGRPYVLLAQPSAADSSRTPDHRTVSWAYAHVPNGLDDAGTQRTVKMIEDEISRYAPEFRDAVLERRVWGPNELEEWNANLIGGSLTAGLGTLGQTFAGPASARQPYTTGIDGVYMCSASTPPGGGAHGMSGYNAAHAILKDTEIH